MKYLTILSALILVTCAKPVQGFKTLKNSTKIQLLVLDATETEDIHENALYVENRKIVKEVELTDREKQDVVEQLSRKDNYEPISRRCKLEPVYALKVDGKLFATFDVEFCPLLKYKVGMENDTLVQLVADNSLKDIIKNISER